MNWLIIVFITIPVLVTATILFANGRSKWCLIAGSCIMSLMLCVLGGIGIPLGIVKQNIYDKHDWYIETRLKYAEAEGIEKLYLEMNDVAVYNMWYERNKDDLENPWNFKNAAGCKFDYIKIGD